MNFNGFLYWWQHLPQNIDPVIFRIGSFKPQYYGLMYIFAFAAVYFLVQFRIKKEKNFSISKEQVGDLCIALIFGVIIGGRLGYVVFYNFSYYFQNPLEIILPFRFGDTVEFTGISGMSYHGGLIGVITAAYLYISKHKLNFAETFDLFIPTVPLGYTFGRMGNFINGELFGRVTDSPIGMYFPLAYGNSLRHPSQLYEAFFEGIFLFAVLWSIRKIKVHKGAMLPFYLIGYGSVRFFIEYFREPDVHIGFVFLNLSLGQVLCLGMIAAAGTAWNINK